MKNHGAIYLQHLLRSEAKLKGYAPSVVFTDPLMEQSATLWQDVIVID